MKREEIRAFIKAGVDAVATNIKFNSGRISQFTSQLKNTYPYVWSEPLSIQGNTWNVSLLIANIDKLDSLPEQYEAIVDECDLIAQKLISQYRIQLTGYDKLAIDPTNPSREPFIKRHNPDCTTGVNLTFEIQDYDPTDVC